MNLRVSVRVGGHVGGFIIQLTKITLFLYRENISEITLGRNLDADCHRRAPGAAPHWNNGWFG